MNFWDLLAVIVVCVAVANLAINVMRHRQNMAGVKSGYRGCGEGAPPTAPKTGSGVAPASFKISVNGHEHSWSRPTISYEDICALANKNPAHNPSCVYWSRTEKGQGLLRHGQSCAVREGMIIDCMVTGAA